jgi:hypothetical protein
MAARLPAGGTFGVASRVMGLFDWFRSPPPIVDRPALVDYLDTRAAFIVQKGIFEFSRAAAGMMFSSLIKEQAFIDAMDQSRWKSYPLGLAIIAELVHGVLRPEAAGAMPLAEVLKVAAFEAIDRYPVPKPIGAEAWAEARDTLGQRVVHIALHPRKAVKDIPIPFADQFFANLPIHERLRGRDTTIVTSNLRTTLITLHEDFERRAVVAALVRALGVEAQAPSKAATGG